LNLILLLAWQGTKELEFMLRGLEIRKILSVEIEDDLKAWIVGMQWDS
jgi:hypothetical protein